MHFAKFLKRRLIFQKFLPECLPYLSRAYTYYGGFSTQIKEYQDLTVHRPREQTKVVDSSSSLAEKMRVFKSLMMGCMDPVKKYDYLTALRNHSIELYYHYLCNNTVEVFSVLSAVDGISDDFYRMGSMLINKLKRSDVIIEPMDISSAVDYLRRRVNDQRLVKFPSVVGSTLTTENVKENAITNFVIYLKSVEKK